MIFDIEGHSNLDSIWCITTTYLEQTLTGNDHGHGISSILIFQINSQDVRQASHETVVTLIRKSGDLVQLNVVSVSYDQSAALSLPPTPNNNQNHR